MNKLLQDSIVETHNKLLDSSMPQLLIDINNSFPKEILEFHRKRFPDIFLFFLILEFGIEIGMLYQQKLDKEKVQ